MHCVHLSVLLAAIFSAWLLQTVSNNHDNQSVATVLCRIQIRLLQNQSLHCVPVDVEFGEIVQYVWLEG